MSLTIIEGRLAKATAIRTFTGKVVDLSDPQTEDFCIEDIAHSLAFQCRWTGHTKEFYSVAQHSVVASFVPVGHPAYLENTREWDKIKLLHDAGEAYYGDLATPFKKAMDEAYQVVKQPIDIAIEEALLGYGVKPELYRAIVKPVDGLLLSLEGAWLMGLDIPKPEQFGTCKKCKFGKLMGRCWGPEEAEERFLERWKELKG